MSESEKSYSVTEIAAMEGVTAQTVRNWIADGKLESYRHGARGNHRVTIGALKRFHWTHLERFTYRVGGKQGVLLSEINQQRAANWFIAHRPDEAAQRFTVELMDDDGLPVEAWTFTPEGQVCE